MQIGDADTLETLLRARRSVRGFRPDPVPQGLIARALAMAQQAPSNCNVQPWSVHVVSGNATGRMRARLIDSVTGGTARTPDFPLTQGYPGVYRERQIDSAKALFAATGVARGDDDARRRSLMRNFSFFDAPHAAFIFMPSWGGVREAADCGMFAQSLMLAFTALGLASCAQASLSHHAGPIRETLGIDDEHRLLFGLSFGYEDAAHPANATRTDRAPIDQAAVFHG